MDHGQDEQMGAAERYGTLTLLSDPRETPREAACPTTNAPKSHFTIAKNDSEVHGQIASNDKFFFWRMTAWREGREGSHRPLSMHAFEKRG